LNQRITIFIENFCSQEFLPIAWWLEGQVVCNGLFRLRGFTREKLIV